MIRRSLHAGSVASNAPTRTAHVPRSLFGGKRSEGSSYLVEMKKSTSRRAYRQHVLCTAGLELSGRQMNHDLLEGLGRSMCLERSDASLPSMAFSPGSGHVCTTGSSWQELVPSVV